jgi:transposase
MVLCSKLQVPLPKQGIIIRKTGKHQYVYKVTKTYRNKNKQPTNTRTAIGKLDPKTNMLIPNNNYWQHYNNYTTTTNPTTTQTPTNNQEKETTPTYQSIHSIGATYLIKKLYDNLNITNILTTTFGEKRANDILTTATYMTTQGNIFEHILNWSQTHLLHQTPLTSPAASQLFNSITPQEQIAFFQAWIKQQPKPPKYLAYDVTSFSSYSTNIAEVEWGYNRDKEKLPQINIGCYLDQQTGLPLFYVTYPGSIVDKSHLPYMMAYNKTLNVNTNTCHVMDRGFCSEANIVHMQGKSTYF